MNTKYYNQLQGLRCIACLLVIADHCNLMGLAGHGGVSVAFFFALSGFLLVMPWSRDGEDRFLSLSGILKFYYKKLIRLLPAYYLIVLVHAFLADYCQGLPGNLTFTNVTGHFWYIQQYLVMLVVFPLFMIIISFLKKKGRLNNLIIAVLLLIAAYLSRKYLSTKIFYLMGNDKKQRFRIGLMLVGMSAGYFRKWKTIRIQNPFGKFFLDAVSAVIIAASVFCAGRFVEMVSPALANYQIAWTKDFQISVLGSLLILIVMSNPDGIVSKILSSPPAMFGGELSYYIYLVHPVLMTFVPGISASRLYLRILILSICVAFTLHSILDPLLGKLARSGGRAQ